MKLSTFSFAIITIATTGNADVMRNLAKRGKSKKQGKSAKVGKSNPCYGAKLQIDDSDCYSTLSGVAAVLGQAGADVSVGYVGGLDTAWDPITIPFSQAGLCPVNVHWHLGAEHRSEGEFDETFDANGPAEETHRMLSEGRQGFRCKHYDVHDAKFTTEYDWQHCVDMVVGETYEVHWPHSALGDCGTKWQYQTPFLDGVFCHIDMETFLSLGPEDIKNSVGVQSQVFTIVNDESYYYPDLISGMIVNGAMGQDITKYTGSTTGDKYNNEVCSNYTPITWQVDRKCHLISASSFDKLCADMQRKRDDMSEDLHPHGSREIVDGALVSNNQRGNREQAEMVYGNFVY